MSGTSGRALLTTVALVVLAAMAALLPAGAGAAPSASQPDPRIGQGDCRLLGRVYERGHGCSRDRCLPPAYLVKAAYGAELCALRREGAYAFGSAVEYRRCRALHRRWIAEVNWCASNPDRGVPVIAHAPQCRGRASTYITHTEVEGSYDQCLTPEEVHRLSRLARRGNTTLEREALLRSRALCDDRPGHVFLAGQCVPGHDPSRLAGGVLLVGDSIAWRGADELGPLRPQWHLDGIPSRQIGDLASRLDRFRIDHGEPDGLIVELGTNASRGYTHRDLTAVVTSLPSQTPVMLVLPYRANSHTPVQIQPSSTRYARWMRTLAAERPNTCVADWRALVARRPRLLVDGVHPTSRAESSWAHWLSSRWSRCP